MCCFFDDISCLIDLETITGHPKKPFYPITASCSGIISNANRDQGQLTQIWRTFLWIPSCTEKETHPFTFTFVFSSAEPVLPKYHPAGSRLEVLEVAIFNVTEIV